MTYEYVKNGAISRRSGRSGDHLSGSDRMKYESNGH